MRYLQFLLFTAFLCLVPRVAHAEPDPDPKDDKKGETTDAEKLAAALKREEDYKKEIEGLKNPKKPDPKDDDGLNEKARKEREAAEKEAASTKEIERALGFNLGIDQFVKTNESLLPTDIASIVKLAHKENYANATAKAGALKAAIIQSYFGVQANVDALTAGQKRTLDEYLKLTKDRKEQNAPDIYENVFEPALETIRKVKKAEEVGRSRAGFANPSDADAAYKAKMVKHSQAAHLGVKT